MVFSQQTDDGVTQDPIQILNKDGVSDVELLARKATSHEGYGWTVTHTSPTTFTATKIRGIDPRTCVRQFWID